MPWPSIDALPTSVKNPLPPEAADIWRKAANDALERGEDEQTAAQIGWTAVRNAGYRKVGDNWVKGSKAAEGGETVSFPDVELVSTGTWAASTGTVTIKREDLEDMLAAARDLDIDRAPIRIGHIDPRFDGEPALGWVTNLRITGPDDQGRHKLRGDIVEVPAKLEKVIPRAFRRRSVEISWGVRTIAGKRYRAALTGLALLGVAAPAVKGLEDIVKLFGEDPDRRTHELLIKPVDDVVELEGADRAFAVASTSSLAVGERLDQDAVVSAITTLAEAASTTPVAILAALGASELPGDGGGPGDNGDTDTDQEGEMDEKRLRELLGLEEDQDVEAAVKDLKNRAEAKPPEDEDKPEGDQPKPEGEGKPDQVRDEDKPELVTLSAGQWAQTQQDIKDGAEARKILRQQEIDSTITTALAEGRIAPADINDREVERDDGTKVKKVGWRSRLELDFEGTKSLLSGLTPAFPVREVGSEEANEITADEAAWARFEQEVFGIETKAPEGS